MYYCLCSNCHYDTGIIPSRKKQPNVISANHTDRGRSKYMEKSRWLLSLLLLTFLLACSAYADSWALPEKRTVCSKNNKYCLKVIPKKLESQLSYFGDKVDGKENAGTDKKAKKNYCRGIFYSRNASGRLKKLWETKLVNEVSPVRVLVSDQGDYVVTFDNWHSVGYGDDTVAIYTTSNGSLIRKFGLSDFLTDSDIYELPASVSSIHWGGTHWIDKDKNQLVLEVTKGKRTFEKDAEFFQIRAELNTGKILDEKRDRLPSLKFVIQPIDEDVAGVASSLASKDTECFGGKESEKISAADLLKKAIKQERPNYPPAAKAVRATGKVVVEILVASDGTVECVRAVSGHPFLRASVVAAVKKWKFEIAQRSYSGFIVFEGTSALVSPDGTIIKESR